MSYERDARLAACLDLMERRIKTLEDAVAVYVIIFGLTSLALIIMAVLR